MNRERVNFLFGLLLFVLRPSAVGAAEIYEFYNGVRPLGMGGAGIAVVNDETALLVNPAGLGKLRDYFITIADPEAEVGGQTEQISGLETFGMTDPQKALEKCKDNPDKHLHGRAQIFPSLVVPNFGVGLYGRVQFDAQVNSTDNTFLYDYTRDYAMVFGFNFRFFNGIFKLGTNLRVTDRTTIRRDDIDPNSTNLSADSLASSGVGVGSDTGVMLSAPIRWLPTLAAVYRDVGRTSYAFRDGMFMKTSSTGHPDSTPESLDVALALYPILGKRLRSTWTFEVRDVLTLSEEKDQMRRYHAGFELNYADALFLRAGMNQRYWTAGLEFAMMNYQFQAASYGEEIGTDSTPREDRRYALKFAFRF
ncbi:MAG: hypothetical protein HC902_10875 [Calothrix sp. SM1_5_4]|nr:hypothetical protein [Calothrix sp. SM1_5_4]